MKKFITLSSVAFAITVACISCAESKDMAGSQLAFKGTPTFSSIYKDTIVFTSDDIKSFNGSTGELSFSDPKTNTKIKNYFMLQCYIGKDSLFSVNLTSDIMSYIVNDLVLNHNMKDGKLYLQDGYPSWINNSGAVSLRTRNKERRVISWTKFIKELKKEGKYKE